MTDSLSALRLITETGMPDRERALASFYERWRDEPLVVNKWFALQAMIEDEAAVERVEGLMAHPAFAWAIPTGSGRSWVLRDDEPLGLPPPRRGRLPAAGRQGARARPPEPAGRGPDAVGLGPLARFDEARQGLMRAQLERVVAAPGLSRDSYEIASKSLA